MQSTIFGPTFQLRLKQEYFYFSKLSSPLVVFPFRVFLMAPAPRDFRIRSALVGENVDQPKYNNYLSDNNMQDRYVILPYSAIFDLSSKGASSYKPKFLLRRSEYFGILGKEITDRGFIGHDKLFLLRKKSYLGLFLIKGATTIVRVGDSEGLPSLIGGDKHFISKSDRGRDMPSVQTKGRVAKFGLSSYRRIISRNYSSSKRRLHERTFAHSGMYEGISIKMRYREIDIGASLYPNFVSFSYIDSHINLNGISAKYGIMSINGNTRNNFVFSWKMGRFFTN